MKAALHIMGLHMGGHGEEEFWGVRIGYQVDLEEWVLAVWALLERRMS